MAKEISVKDEIRNYVRLNNNSVTCQEVITYILEEKKIKKTPASIRKTLWEVLKETGGTLKPYTKSYNLKEEIRNYVIAHNNYVTSKEVITYILEEKKIQETEKNIRGILSIVLKETGGKLKNRIKHYGLTAEIRNYVKTHNNAVTSKEVITYILEEKKIKTTETAITGTLRSVLKETGGILKPYGLTAEIRNYVKTHNNAVTSKEVIDYILEEKKIKKTPKSIRRTLWQVLKETGGTLIKK